MQADAAQPARRLEAVLFDLDGTLADTLRIWPAPSIRWPAGSAPVRWTRRGCGPWSRAAPGRCWQACSPTSPTARGSTMRGAGSSNATREGVAVRTRLFPGMDAVLDTLERHGVRWGVVTNKHAWLTEPLLEALGLRRRAACVVSGDSAAHPKPHPAPLLLACERLSIAPDAAAYVGDSRSDVESGRAAGMVTLSAGWGYFDPDDPPHGWGADVDTGTPGDLLAWVRSALAGRSRRRSTS